MPEITITEALQEIKTITARLEKKRNAIGRYIGRDARARDPFEADGGSEKYVREERQSITDLEERIVSIRCAIQKANLSNLLKIGEVSRSVSAWLTWRREVAPGRKALIQSLSMAIASIRNDIQKKGGRAVIQASAQVISDPTAPPEIVINLNEQGILKEIEHMEEILGTLDGRLSLFNAITIIEV